MDYSCGVGTSLSVCENVSHNIVTGYLFALCCHFIVNVVYVLLQLLHLCLCNRETELHFGSCESHPELSPCSELLIRRENILHFLACITCAEWAFIAVDITAHVDFTPFTSIQLYHHKPVMSIKKAARSRLSFDEILLYFCVNYPLTSQLVHRALLCFPDMVVRTVLRNRHI